MNATEVDWKDLTLGDVLTLQRGFDITKREQRPGRVPVVSSSGVSSTHDMAKVDAPGVVVGRKGSLGTTYYLEEPFWPHDTTLWVKDFKGNDPYFCYLLLKTLNLKELDAGSSNPTLNRNHAHLLAVRRPPRETQARIGSTLAAFDELIEVNERRIEVLEDLARSLYREWFVRFRFPGHENVDLVDSELGAIPRGWRVEPMAKVAGGDRHAITSGPFGSKLGRKDYVEGGVPVIRGANLRLGGGFVDRGFVFVTESKADELASSIAKPKDIVITQRGTLGQVGLVPESPSFDRYVISQSQMKVTIDPQTASPQYVYSVLRSADTTQRILNMAITAGVPHINLALLREMLIVVPPLEAQLRFEGVVGELNRRIELGRQTTVTLSNSRDLLLPRLVTGQLDISDIDLGVLTPPEAA